MQLNELRINSDEELELWKSQWNGTDPIPEEVHQFMIKVFAAQTDRFDRWKLKVENEISGNS